MPVEFLTDDEAAAYGRYAGTPAQADLDRVFFLDDDDLKLVGKHRGEHMRADTSGTAVRAYRPALRTRSADSRREDGTSAVWSAESASQPEEQNRQGGPGPWRRHDTY